MICTKCGYENPPIAKFCGRCGTPQQTNSQQHFQQPQMQQPQMQQPQMQQPQMQQQYPARPKQNKGIFGMFLVSPIGALIAIICFGLPWINVNCAGSSLETMSGFKLAFDYEEILIVSLALAVLILIAVPIFKFIKKPIIGMPVAIAGSVISLLIMFIKYNEYIKEYGKEIFKIKFGAIGTAAGFIIAIIGGILLLFEKKE